MTLKFVSGLLFLIAGSWLAPVFGQETNVPDLKLENKKLLKDVIDDISDAKLEYRIVSVTFDPASHSNYDAFKDIQIKAQAPDPNTVLTEGQHMHLFLSGLGEAPKKWWERPIIWLWTALIFSVVIATGLGLQVRKLKKQLER